MLPGKEEDKYSPLIDQAYEEAKKQNTYFWGMDPNRSVVYTGEILTLSDKQKVDFILDSIHFIHQNNGNTSASDEKGPHVLIREAFLTHMLKTKLLLDEGDIIKLIHTFQHAPRYGSNSSIRMWPVGYLITQVERYLKSETASPELLGKLNGLRKELKEKGHGGSDKDGAKLVTRIDKLIFQCEAGANAVRPVWFSGQDPLGEFANSIIKDLPQNEKDQWFQILELCQKASGASPTAKYLKESKVLIDNTGTGKFQTMVDQWIRFIVQMKEVRVEHRGTYSGGDYSYSSIEFLSAPNMDMVKGLVWFCVHLKDRSTLLNLASLAERSFRKIPGKGPAAASIGNACLWALANSGGLEGVAHLSRLRLRIKQTSTQNLIEKYLNQAAAEQGVSVYEIEDMAVDDYGLIEGKKTHEFDGYKAVLSITGVGKSETSWFKSDGTLQKSVPALVKSEFAKELKEWKESAKEIDLTTSAQRDRIDRMFRTERELSWDQFNEFYFSHGLMSFMAHQLIWNFSFGNQKQSGIYVNNEWQNPSVRLDPQPGPGTKVSLWHPVFSSVEEIATWRRFLIENKIMQPLKQAFREVYLLTDAEINTGTYSNRMAAHILKQHQFNSLAKTRGWKYSLLGAYDDGRDNEIASIVLPESNIRGEFWVNEVNADNAFNDTGIWNFVSTDQVRFVRQSDNEVLRMTDVPQRVFTEVMRDVDLFVGVASVGNDPAWSDNGGLVQYRDYWQSYSFGDLSEVAKTRKATLERIIPRLKIAGVAEVRDRFLVVKGKLRTYKIHIGSTNILMEPNDQYLCIVPDRSVKNETGNLFLPFEGDNGVSVILSKALLLADDDKITDTTITRQINRQ